MSATRRVAVSQITETILSTKARLPQPDTIRSLIVLCTLIALISGCAHAKTPGEQFRQIMADIDKQCRKEQRGPYETQPPSNGIRYSDCDILLLKPQDPLATPEGRFAHAIQLPPTHDKPKDVYKSGMTSEEYFKALCEAEAGEFVFKTVENVDGIYVMRRGEPPDDYRLMHLYANEGPTGLQIGDFGNFIGEALVQPNIGRYQFVETNQPESKSNSAKYVQYYRDATAKLGKTVSTVDENGYWKQVPDVLVNKSVNVLRSEYGYTWRGITRPNDRELGIAGGEIIVMKVATAEVLAIRRIFRRTGASKGQTNVWWLTAQNCSKNLAESATTFIYGVLKPSKPNRSTER